MSNQAPAPAPSVLVTKETFLRVVADLQGVQLPEVAKASGRDPSVFHRWLKGTKTSAPLDRFVGKRLGLTQSLLRRLT
jgi:hypothetical protein